MPGIAESEVVALSSLEPLFRGFISYSRMLQLRRSRRIMVYATGDMEIARECQRKAKSFELCGGAARPPLTHHEQSVVSVGVFVIY